MYTIVETPTFKKDVEKLLSESEREALCAWLAAHPKAGKVVPKSGGLRKVRWGYQGKGTRGGARIIYYNRLNCGEIWLLVIYAKKTPHNIPAHILRAIKDAIENE